MGCNYSEIDIAAFILAVHLAAFIMEFDELNMDDLIFPIFTSMGKDGLRICSLISLLGGWSMWTVKLPGGTETLHRGKGIHKNTAQVHSSTR